VRGPPGATAERCDRYDASDALLLERLGGGPGETDVCILDALGRGVRRAEPEHCIGPSERRVHDAGIAVRALDDLDALARLRREVGGVAHDHAKRLAGVEQVLEDLAAD